VLGRPDTGHDTGSEQRKSEEGSWQKDENKRGKLAINELECTIKDQGRIKAGLFGRKRVLSGERKRFFSIFSDSFPFSRLTITSSRVSALRAIARESLDVVINYAKPCDESGRRHWPRIPNHRTAIGSRPKVSFSREMRDKL